MTYLKFTLWLFGLYFIYYAALIFWDLLKAKAGRLILENTFSRSKSLLLPRGRNLN